MKNENSIGNEINLAKDDGAFYDAKKDFTTLEAWKKARKVKLFFYRKILPVLPKIEKYQLAAQIRDASVSSTLYPIPLIP